MGWLQVIGEGVLNGCGTRGESSLQAVGMRVRTFTVEKCGGS